MQVTKLSVTSILHATAIRGGFCDPAVWKQLEGCGIANKSGKVVGTVISSRADNFSADGVEILINIHGEQRSFSPRNLPDCQITWLKCESGFPADLSDKVIAYEQAAIFKRARRLFMSKLEDCYALLGKSIQKAFIPAPLVGEADCALALQWANRSANPEDLCPQGVAHIVGSYEGARLVSARVAELAAIDYYDQLGCDVVDVSIRQLNGSDELWKDFDLLIDQDPIDIKNARRSFSSKGAYSEYCVPRFKLARTTQREVTITGVLSEYLDESRVGQKMGGHCVILGEIKKSSVTRLIGWMTRQFGALLDFEGIWRESYQPGWVFDYPQKHYETIAGVRAEIASMLEAHLKNGGAPEDIPGAFLLLLGNGELSRNLARTDLHRKILDDLIRLRSDCGLSRPALYLYITGRFLSAIASGEDGEALGEALQNMLFLEKEPSDEADGEFPDEELGASRLSLEGRFPRWCQYPAGLFDPMGYVYALINSLASAAKVAHAMEMKFLSFRMSHPEVIRGLTSERRWISIIAYCGGWRRNPFKVSCGQSPLYLGKNDVCEFCGCLICEACGFCSKGCHACAPRQSDFAHS